MNKQTPNPGENKHILLITYAVVGMFVCLMGYFGYFLQVQSETVINNSYNARLDSFSDRIIRGKILSNEMCIRDSPWWKYGRVESLWKQAELDGIFLFLCPCLTVCPESERSSRSILLFR